ncbi:acyl-CoA dehydrogenase [Effusibacillus lacus]|uniref:Acyl-CoA dehydrogenase n=1 Tax=Effusibacillus lacus TaxID=1348429 RepID=A0A292YCW7_9BACL|nr:acyl-CoA dehydrogenase [Effusibacillus lacus]TCS70484.1 alkylation response protein AidB-like acyl-CoA dehydrogenase [Effusibacillus lacus]GAX89562.1 acyl-CoA dehydrogenase [Effusibacillus lacus]
MDFLLTQEQLEIRNMVRQFAQKEIIPQASKIDEEDRFPRELVRKMGELGLMGIPIPEEWGGVGSDFISYMLAIEEISYASAALGVILAVHTSVGTMPILKFGNGEQKNRYLEKLATGQMLGAFALTEPGAGSDASRITTRAVKQGDSYVLNGSKIFITNGGEADLYITFAVTDSGKGPNGISAFIVEKDTPGFTVGKKEKKMGLNGSSTTALVFEDAKIPASQLLGEEGEGFQIAMSNLDGGRIGIAAQALGIARAAFDTTLAYVKQREQFGQPIADFQGVRFMLADMATKMEAARLLVYRAAQLRQQGLPCSKEASMAKYYAADTAMSVTTDAVQLHGGYGYMKEYPVERFMRDAKVTQIYEGTNQIQRIVVAKNLLKD